MKKTRTFLQKVGLSFFLFLFFIATSLEAQITISLSDLPNLGNTAVVAYETNPAITIGPASLTDAQVWDFTNLSTDNTSVVEFKNPADTPYGSNYPLATFARTDEITRLLGFSFGDLIPGADGFLPISTAYYGINPTTENIFMTGIVTDLDLGFLVLEELTLEISPPDLYLTPLALGETITNSATMQFDIDIDLLPIAIPVNIYIDREITADAYGTVYLPTDTFEVIRYHDVSSILIDVEFDLIPLPLPDTPIVVHNYRFIANGIGFPVASTSSLLDGPDAPMNNIEFVTAPGTAVVDFDLDDSCLSIATLNTSNFTYGFTWDFGDGNTSGLLNAQHTYENEGTYTVTLSGITFEGDTIQNSQIITVQCPVSANFGSSSSCFTANFSNTTENGASYVWDFGDGNTSTEAEPSHTYDNEGNYIVSLISTGIVGDVDTISYDIEVACPLTAAIDYTSSCLTVLFIDNSENAVSYEWDFGDGNTSTEAEPSHTYTESGNYPISVTITGANGTQETINLGIAVSCPPSADFSYTIAENCLTVDFSNASVNGASYSWDFGDGANSTDENPSYTYNESGDYTVTLTVTGIGDDIVQLSETLSIACVGIDYAAAAAAIRAYPNPSQNWLYISGLSDNQSVYHISLYTITGKTLLNELSSQDSHSLDLSHFSSGLYLLSIRAADGRLVREEKIIIE